MNKSKFLHRIFRSLGLKVERFRDPVAELQGLVKGPVARAVDGGAYRGTVSQDFLRMFPSAEVHAFEPQPDLFGKLAEAAAAEPRWRVHNLALSDRQGEQVFHVPDAAFTASLLTPAAEFGATREVQVRTTTLDAWAEEHGPADLLKLDLQGAELQALQGARKMLAEVRVILCEVNFLPRYEGCSQFHEVAAFLAEQGFSLHRLYEVHVVPSGAWEMADAIFVRR